MVMEAAASSPLFNQGNPFGESAIQRSHYHPSSPRRLHQQQRQQVIKPDKHQQFGPVPGPPSPPDPENPPGPVNHVPLQRSSSHLEESWPSTESSSPQTPEGTKKGDSLAGSVGGSLTHREVDRRDTGWSESPETALSESSVIAKYIQRFRQAKPQSREDRERAAAEVGTEFWWLRNSPPISSTPTEDNMQFNQGFRSFITERGESRNYSPVALTRIERLRGKTPQPSLPLPSLAFLKTGLSSVEEPSDVSQLEPFDADTIHLQERANRLLERSDSSHSGPVPVSSDGVGSPSACDSVEEPSRRPAFILSGLTAEDTITRQVCTVPAPHYLTRTPPLCARPEDDILYQWRLQRKMEAARDSPWPTRPIRKFQSPAVRLVRQIGETDEGAQEDRMVTTGSSPDSGWRGGEIPATTPTHCAKTRPEAGAPVPSPLLNPTRPEWAWAEPVCHRRPSCPQPAAEVQRSDPEVMDTGRGQWGGGDRGLDPHLGAADEGQRSAESLSEESSTGGAQRSEGAAEIGLRPQVPRPDRPLTDTTERMWRGHGPPRGGGKAGRSSGREICGTVSPALTQPRRQHDATPQREKPSPPSPRHPSPGWHDTHPDQESSSSESWSPPTDRPCTGRRHRRRAGRVDQIAQSEVRHALGQVLSERLFSPPASAQHAARKPKKAGKTRENQLSPSPIPGPRKALEAVTQLLEEAEESDGKEFQEDSLLQVLRQQRDWVKQQIREADRRLTVLEGHER
ncbi:proline and serine-rich protein 3 [Heterodontus francisci]|uniref:proline and serine-rich protein 3 n=1 Tax=Heterodontus francisci TaxID=7792 RepID=UPI00355B496C